MYAVVVFTKESSDTFKSVQEIPVSWLSEDRKFCRWPPKNSSIYTAKNVQPQDDWPWHPVEVEIICDSLKEAKKKSKKEVSTDDEQLGKGFRTPKPKDYYSPDTSIPRRRMDKDQYEFPPTLQSINNHVAPVTVERMNLFLPGEHYVNTVISNEQNQIDVVEPEPITPESMNSEGTLLTELGVVSDADEISSGRSVAEVNRLEEKFDKIIEILSEHKLILEELLGQRQKEKSSLEPFAFDLPLGNLEDITSLEGKLADKKFLALFVKHLENVGGNGPKDFVCRLLKTVFTNQLGELCSWTGAKNNFKINDLKLVSAIYHAVYKKFEISKRDFEIHVKDWLRNSKQRRIREESKDEKNNNVLLSLDV